MILLRCLSPPHRVAFQDRSGGMSNGQGKHNNPTTEMATTTSTEKRMHTARPRDGGRTQSGGIKGILPESRLIHFLNPLLEGGRRKYFFDFIVKPASY